MHVKYEVIISYSSKVIAKVKVDNRRTNRETDRQTDRQDKNNGHLFFLISQKKNTNLVEDVKILLPVKFRWIPFSGFREEVEHVSANQRPGSPFYFSDRPEKPKLGRRHWDLVSCQVLLNSVKRFQRSSRKCLSESEAGAAILFFRSADKNTILVEDVEILLPVKFRWIPFTGLEKKSKMSQPIRGQGGHLVFPIGSKNTNLVEGVEILLSVKFRWIPFSGFRGEVENVEVYAGRTDDGRTTNNSSLEPSAQVS